MIFTYLTLDIKIWLWLWDLIFSNISGDPALYRSPDFFSTTPTSSNPRFPMTAKALTKRVPLSLAKIIFSAPLLCKIWQI